MAKELPYFKFEPNQWENGSIQYFNRAVKGLFMDLCSMYWSRLGELDYALALQKLCNGDANELELLMQRDIFVIQDDKIVIEFLDEQLNEFQETSVKRRQAAKKRWKNNTDNQSLNASALQNSCKSNAIREDKSRVDKKKEEKIKENTLLSEIKISDLESGDVEYFEIAKAFNQLFIKNLEEKNAPTASQKKAKYKDYVDPIRLMMVDDGVTKAQLTTVFKFLDSPDGDFWKSIILSTKKLREKFEQLTLKSQIKTNGKQQDNNQQGGASQAYREKVFKGLTNIQSE